MKKKSKNRTLNEYRQVKDSNYTSPDYYTVNGIAFLCDIYPNDEDLGAVVRRTFSPYVKRK